MIKALKEFLTAKGYQNIFRDMIPDAANQLEAISLLQWDHTMGAVNDGTGLRFIQIQVRRGTYDEAKNICTALFQLLDSGIDETPIHFTPDVFVIARPRRGPVKMESTGDYTTFYFELVLWGQN